MGISFNIDADVGIIYAIAEGKIGAEDVHAYRKNLFADPLFFPGLGEIVEYRLSDIQISEEETKILASTRPTELSGKLALVVVGIQERGALRFKEMVKDVPVEVFTDMRSAKKWVTSD